MDTDDLSIQAYKAIISEAEKFHHSLTIQFGILAMDCKTEEDYLKVCEKLISALHKLEIDDWEDVLYEPVGNYTLKNFHTVLEKIEKNIKEVRKIPMEKRAFDY